jgi:exodeoxyribonuclease V alpha subunit
MLRHSQRFGGVIGDLARAVNSGDTGTAESIVGAPPGSPVFWIAAATTSEAVDLAVSGRSGATGGYRVYLELIRQRAGERARHANPDVGASGVAFEAMPGRSEVDSMPARGLTRSGGSGGALAAAPGLSRSCFVQGPGPDDEDAHAAWVRAVWQAFERFRVLCAVREGDWGVAGLNRAIERRLEHEQLLEVRGEWYEGRPVIVTRNDYGLGVFNGDIGIVLKPPGNGADLRAYFVEGDSIRSVSASRLADVETAFALTVHKSQGSEFEHTVLVLPPGAQRVVTRELVYTGVTRARAALTLVTPRREVLGEAIAQRIERSSGLPDWLHPT